MIWTKMFPTSKIKLIAYLGIGFSAISLFVHLFIANSSAGGPYKVHVDDLYPVQVQFLFLISFFEKNQLMFLLI